jgi:hypothetical protein
MFLVLALVLALLPGKRIARASTYTVTSTDNAGFGTLRQAIFNANHSLGSDVIEFDISIAGNDCDFQTGVCTIQPTSPLPALYDAGTTINGYTQPGAAKATATTPATLKIVIRGSSAGAGADGLTITSANNVIKGLVIRGFSSNGVHVHDSGTTGNVVSGNTIGGGNETGVRIDGGAQNNTIGGGTPAERNVIFGNDGSGVYISGVSTTGNTISGNYIGVYTDGATAVGNKHGVTIGDGAQNNAVGEGNVISGNDGNGVRIHSGATGNTVSGNVIGADAGTTAALGNGADGVYIFSDTQDNAVGPGNVIAHNGGDGVAVSGRHVSGNTVTQNSIFSNALGIDLAYDANGDIAAPVILDVTSGPVDVIGTACPGCTVELFENDDADGEGETFLGITTADADGDFSLTVSSLGDPYLTATATDPVSGTSEFSAAFTASGAKRFAFLPLVLRNEGSSGGACPSPSGPTVHNGGHLAADETWRAADGPHQVMGTIMVNEGATLTIEPCAEVQLAEDVRIVVRGALAAEGAAGQPILFTALDDEPWRSIYIEYPATGSFAYATIENGGSDFVNDDGASLVAEVDEVEYPERTLRQFVKLNHVTVKDSAGFGILMDDRYAGFTDDSAHLIITGSGKSDPNHDHPIHISAPALGTLPSGRYTGNAVDAIWVGDWNRAIVADVTVQDRGVPYHVVHDVYVEPESESAPDPTLILRPGVEMRFDPDTVLHVGSNWHGGALVAEGTASQPVTFKAWDATTPWNSIEVRYPATVSLTHVVMQDGGAERINYEGALLFVEADDAGQGLDQVTKIVKVDHVTLKDSGGYGIFMGGLVGFTDHSTALTITGCGQDGPDFDDRFIQPVRLTAMAMGTLPSGEYTGNAADVILVIDEHGIHRDVTVRDLGVPYQLGSYGDDATDVYADPADGPAPTLTIEAGVEMRFEEGERLLMGCGASHHPGGLQILGTAVHPVVLTSAAAAPAPGDWVGVEFDAPPGGATNSITHARIAYAGGDNDHSNYSCGVGNHGDDGAITFFEWRPDSAFVTSSEILHSAANGFVRGWEGEGGTDFTEDTDNTFIDIVECDQTNPKYAECPDCE